MQLLMTVSGSFHARLLAARLGAEDVLVELRGLSDGPYPFQGPVDVLVESDRLELAREILLADAVEDAFSDGGAEGGVEDGPVGGREGGSTGIEPSGAPEETSQGAERRPRLGRLPAALALGVVLLLVVVVVVAAGR